jgi:hypothetical protein
MLCCECCSQLPTVSEDESAPHSTIHQFLPLQRTGEKHSLILTQILQKGKIIVITRLFIKKFNIGEKSYMFTFLVTYPWVLMVCILWLLGFRRIWLTWPEVGQLFLAHVLAALGVRMAGPPVLGSEEFRRS